MITEKLQLLALIDAYKAAVATVVTLLNAKSEKDPGFQRERTGYLDGLETIKYGFHGFGCLVTTEAFMVDFDFGFAFGQDGRCDGIDPGFLFSFLEDNEEQKSTYSLINSHKQVEQLLQELENDGVVARDVNSWSERLYYLTADIYDSHPPKWQSYPPADDVS